MAVTLRICLLTAFLAASHGAMAEMTVSSVPVKNGYFQAENCMLETDDPKLANNCICKADITKAQVVDLPPKVMTTLNNQLSQLPEQMASESCGGKPTTVPEATMTNTATANYEVVYQSPTILSVLVTYATMTANAAHQNPGSEGYTFDLATGKTMDIGTRLAPEQLARANEFVRQELAKKYTETPIEEAAAPYLSDAGCENCTLYYTKEGWNIRFAVYAVAPYAAGEPTVTIPTSIIPEPETLLTRKK